jgi:hypothetical protein
MWIYTWYVMLQKTFMKAIPDKKVDTLAGLLVKGER